MFVGSKYPGNILFHLREKNDCLQVPRTFHKRPENLDWVLITSGIPICLVARAVNIFPLAAILNLFRTTPLPLTHQVMIWSAGLRGAVAYALSLRLRNPKNGTDDGNAALEIATLSIVVFSTLVLGALTGPIMHTLGLGEDPLQTCTSGGPTTLVDFAGLSSDNNWEVSATSGSFNGRRASTPSNRSATVLRTRRGGAAIGVHAWWRQFDGVWLKPVFGGRHYTPPDIIITATPPQLSPFDAHLPKFVCSGLLRWQGFVRSITLTNDASETSERLLQSDTVTSADLPTSCSTHT